MRTLHFVALAAFIASPAGAAYMESYDLPGLVLRSSAIVIAEREGTGNVGTDGYFTFRVTRVFKGAVLPGQKITVRLWGYSLHTTSLEPKVGEIDRSSFLFLGRPREGDGDPKTTHHLLPSGIKVIAKGRVYGFDQLMNSGPYSLVPERLTTRLKTELSVAIDRSPESAATTESYVGELQKMIARVEELSTCLELEDGPERRRRLFAFLSVRPPPDFHADYEKFFLDGLEIRVLKHLYEGGGIRDVLQGLHRLQTFSLFFLPEEIIRTSDLSELLAAAEDQALTSHLRAAAVLALQNCWWSGNEAILAGELSRLLGDADPQVRLAAAVSLAHAMRHRAIHKDVFFEDSEALSRHLREDSDAFHRVVQLPIAKLLELLPKVYPNSAPGTFILEACCRDSQVLVQWVSAPETAELVTGASFQAFAEDGATKAIHRSAVSDVVGLESADGTRKFPFEPPPPGSYRFWVEARFRLGRYKQLEKDFTIEEITEPVVLKSRVSTLEIPLRERKGN